MCSFLLLFLIVIVGFDTLQNSITEFHPEAAFTPAASTCATHVAFASQKGSSSWCVGASTASSDFRRTPLKGSVLFEEDSYRDQETTQNHGYQPISMALHPLSAHQQEGGRAMRIVQGPLDNRHTSQYRTECTQSNGLQRCMAVAKSAIRLGQLGGLGSLAGSCQSLAEPPEEPASHTEITEPESAQGQRCWEAQIQTQGRCFESAGCRGPEQCELQLLTIRAPCCNTTSMAVSGWSNPESDASCTTCCQFEQSGSFGAEERVCSRASGGIPGCQCSSQGNSGVNRQNGQRYRAPGEREQQVCDKELARSHQNIGQGPKDIDRSPGLEKGPSQSLDQTHHRGCDHMASTARRLPEAARGVPEHCHQGKSRHRDCQERDPRALCQGIPSHARCNASSHSIDSGTGRRRHGGRHRRGEVAGATSICAAAVRRGPEHRDSAAGGRSRGLDHGRWRARQKASAIHAALWCASLCWSYGCQNHMTGGGVLPVLNHGIHDAYQVAEVADAYVSQPTICAASHYQLDNFDFQQLLHWQHSILTEAYYLNPFDAALSAWKLSWSVICDSFGNPLDGDALCNGGSTNLILCKHDFHDVVFPLRSCIRNSSSSHIDHSKSVKFHHEASIHIGLEDEIYMQCTCMNTFDLATWTEKPWTKKPSRSSLASDTIRRHRKHPQISQMRLTDEHADVPRRIAAASTAPRHDQPNQVHLPPPPAFVTDIFRLPGFLALPHDFLMENTFLIRTWYVHHYHFPRWAVPRFVELDHRWVLWQREIAQSWRDMIQPNEDVQFFTVMPDPDRSFLQRQAVADVLVVQGTGAERYAGLLTIHHQDRQGSLRPFAVAISLPDEVSGVGLAAAADISHLCHSHRCNLFFGWQQIPYSLVPSHYMLDGHGFAGHITPFPHSQAAGSARPQSGQAAQQTQQPSNRADGAGRRSSDNGEDDFDYGEDTGHLTDTSLPDSMTQFEQWQGVQVYRLGRPVVHCFLRWGTYNAILHEIAHFLGEHLRNLIGIHHVQCALVGQHEAEESVILQYVNDLPYGSSEKLIILDVEVHFPALTDGLMRAPEVSRRVHRVVPHFSRAYVLRLARLFNYCLLQGDRCLVYWDLSLWPEQDTRVRTTQHGTYLRVVATPPIDQNVPIDTALQFAISIDDDETIATMDCTSQRRSDSALALTQRQASLQKVLEDTLDLRTPAVRALSSQVNAEYLPSWKRQLAQSFNDQGFVECAEEGFVAYITTWFVDHLHNPRCTYNRPVRLRGDEFEEWKDQILEVWQDSIDQSSPVDFTFIKPPPPQTETETTLAHLLLEQHRQPDAHSAGVISVIRHGKRHAALNHIAVSIGRIAVINDFLRKVNLQDLCVVQHCTLTHGRMIMRTGDVEDLDSGFCVIVHVADQTHDTLLASSDAQLNFWNLPQLLWSPAMAAAIEAYQQTLADEQEEQTDNVSFLQVGHTLHHTCLQRTAPLTCKQGEHDDDMGFPVIRPTPDLPRRLRRPRHDGQEDWIPTLGHLFHTQGTRGVWDNELTMHVTTWYIHHNRRVVCRRPRDVMLHGNPLTWIEDLRAAWSGFLDRGRPFTIRIVQPRPPQHLVHPSICHILLEQGQHDQHVAVVLTALMEGTPHDALIQGAYSAPALVNRDIVLQLMELAQFGTHRRCRLLRDRRLLDEADNILLASGHSLCIRIEAPIEPTSAEDPVDQLHFEDLSLMQAPARQPSSSSTDQTGNAMHSHSFNPRAQIFCPSGPNLWLFPDFVQELHSEFESVASTEERDTASIQVLIWFVDHRFHLPMCIFPRVATLHADFTEWEQRIKSAWHEFLQPDLALEITVVSPAPPQLEAGIAAHVTMVQAPKDEWATSLISIIDLNVGPQPTRKAITTHERITFEQVMQVTGLTGICQPPRGRQSCALWHELQQLLPGSQILGWSGFSLVLVIDDLAQQHSTVEDEVDASSLLQRQLSAAVPTENHANQPDSLQIRFDAASRALDQLDTHFTLPVFDLEDRLKDHAHWLPQCLPWIRAEWYAYDQPFDHVSVYYDGSFLSHAGTAGAAAAAFVQQGNRWLFAGAVSAHLAAPEFGSYTAEVRAALLATKQAYDLVKIAVEVLGCRPSVTFHFDSLSVGKQAEGIWQGKKDKVSCHAVRSLLRIMQTRWEINSDHVFVPGHSGDPGNELVDTIALCAAQGFALQDWTNTFRLLTNWKVVQALSWGWIFQHPAFSKYWSESTLCLPPKPQTTPTSNTVGFNVEPSDPSATDAAIIKLELLTCNVLTLSQRPTCAHEGQFQPMGPTRLQMITKQFMQAKVAVFSLQETRLRTTTRLHNPDYFLWHAPANGKGQFGILLGFAKQLPFAFQQDGTPHKKGWFDETDFSVIAADPRYLIIKVQAHFLKCVIVAAHAPHSGADVDSIERFWQQVGQDIPKKYDGWPKLLLADANCRFGDCPNENIGDHDFEISSNKSEAFSHFVATQHLFIPASFSSCHTGVSGTWCHPNGEWTRNDVIGVDLAWPLLACNSWIDTYIDISLLKDDHRPARVYLEWHTTSDQKKGRKSTAKCPPQFCHDALSALKSQQLSFDWFCTDVHTHFHCLQSELAACTRWDTQRFKKKPRKTTMSDDTWELVCTKRAWRKSLADFHTLQKRTFLQAIFTSWKYGCIQQVDDGSHREAFAEFDHLLKQLDVNVATALHQFRCHGTQVTKALRQDDVRFFESLASESSQWLEPKHARELWQTLRRSMPKFRQRRIGFDPLKIEALEEQWLPHFCQLEVGTPVTPDQLLDDCHQRQLHAPVQQRHFDMIDFPTISQLEDALRQTPAGKATGFDVLPSQLFRQHPCDLADLFFPLLLKMYVWQHEPIAGKGGQLAVIHKKGSPFAAQNYRGIMLLPTFTKRVHALLRAHIMSLLHHQRPAGQLGGFAHQQVMYGSQSLQVFGRIMDSQNITSGILFLDLTTAFHRLVREWTSGINQDADLEEVLAAMEAEGLPIDQMCDRLQLPCLLERLGAPAFLIQLIKDVHAHTWMTVGTTQTMATTKRGTRPGSPLADCIFHVLMSDILHHLQNWIDSQEAYTEILQELDIPGSFVAWADDLAIPWATRTADEMPDALRAILRFVMQLFHRYGFLLNMDKGKTSAVVSFRGTGAPLLRQRFQLTPKPGDQILIGEQAFFLHYVPSYKHLGTIFAANHRMDLEIRSRIGQAQAAFNLVSKPILTNRHLPERTRVQLFRSLVETKLFFGLGAWITPTHRQMAKIKAVLLRMLQKVLRLNHESISTTTTAEVFRRTQQPDPRVRLAIDRLLFAQRLWEHGPADLQHLLHREQAICQSSWMDGLLADLAWLGKLEPETTEPVDLSDLTALFDYWQRGTPEWQKRVKRAFRRFQKQEQMMQQMHRFHNQIMKTLHDCATFRDVPSDQPRDDEEHKCFCGRCFTTPQGLATHKRKAHQIGALEKHLIDGPTCPSCLKFFWSRQRLYQHLSYIPRRTQINRCFQDLQKRGFRILEDLPQVTAAPLKGLHRTEALQALGPHLQPKDSRSNELLLTRQKLTQVEVVLFGIQEPEGADEQQQAYWQCLTDATQSWFQRFCDAGFDSSIISQLPDAWLDVAATADPAYPEWLESVYIGWGDKCLGDVIATFEDGEAETLVDNAFADFIFDFPRMRALSEAAFLKQKIGRLEGEQGSLFPHRPPRFGTANTRERAQTALYIPSLYEQQESWLAKVRALKFDTIPDCTSIPRSVEACTHLPVFLVIHLFSGRRRATDIHAKLEEFAQGKGYRVQILSLDTAVSIHYGNLQAGHSTWKFLMTLYKAGRVSATILGAPCETFSAARHHPPDETLAPETARKWPRPLRSATRFFGLSGLTMRELRQAEQGSEFFLQGIMAAAWTLQFGGVYLSEHPWKPEDEAKVSIWTSPWVQMLLQLPNVHLHRVCQWRWGAHAVKPTGILAINCPFFAQSAYKRQLADAVKPQYAAIGRDTQTGAFRTAVLKEYPPAFSAALAGAVAGSFHNAVRQNNLTLGPMQTPEVEAWLQEAVQACAAIRTEAQWLPDFQGWFLSP